MKKLLGKKSSMMVEDVFHEDVFERFLDVFERFLMFLRT